jgi:hypothetical protein
LELLLEEEKYRRRQKLISFESLQFSMVAIFGVKNDDIGPENTYYWNFHVE